MAVTSIFRKVSEKAISISTPLGTYYKTISVRNYKNLSVTSATAEAIVGISTSKSIIDEL